MITKKFVRSPLEIDAVQVTEENMEEVAKWCDGVIKTASDGKTYIKVKTARPLHEAHTRAYPNHWVCVSKMGYKVYTNRSFERNFNEVV